MYLSYCYYLSVYYLCYSFLMNAKKMNNNTDKVVEKEEFFNIFFDNKANQLEDQFFLSKKKHLNEIKEQNELFELLKLKLKGIDMLCNVLSNNKTLIQNENVLWGQPRHLLFAFRHRHFP